MAEVGNLDTCLGGYFSLFLSIFIMTEVGNLLENIIDPMIVTIRVVILMDVCF